LATIVKQKQKILTKLLLLLSQFLCPLGKAGTAICCKISAESVSKRILKTGQYLMKIRKSLVPRSLTHSVALLLLTKKQLMR